MAWPELWFDLPLAVFDIETTGFDVKTCQIIEIGIVQFLRGQVVKVHNWLIDPECEIPPEIVQLTHISQADVEGKPKFREIAHEVLAAFENHGIVAYNISFDRPFLTQKLEDLGLNWPRPNPLFDPLIFAQHFYPKEVNKLGVVAERLGISLEGAHRACNDAEATGKVFYAFRDRLPPDLESLLLLQAQWERENQQRFFHRRNRDNSSILTQQDSGQKLTSAFAYDEKSCDPIQALYRMVPNAAPRLKN